MSLTPGTRLGVYEIVSLLGVGGMGEVYRATDTRLKRQVALKVLPPEVAADPERMARFQREAEMLAALNHANIAAIYGVEESGGVTALVMELVEGATLADRIAAGRIPIDEGLRIANQIVNALEAAHDQGIVHRDLKPANINVRPDGTVKVLDFGLAKAIEAAAAGDRGVRLQPDLTRSPTLTSPALMTGVGVLLGTAAYMAPEQAKGRAVDARADVWAFGAVLFEMLTGQRAFTGDDVPETLAAILRGAPEWKALPADTPPALRRLLRRCLEKDARSRLSSMAMVRLDLHEAEEERSQPTSTAGVTQAPVARWRTAVALIGVAAIAIGVGVVVERSRRPASPTPPLMRFSLALSEPLSAARNALAISPDGTRMAWVGATGLFLKKLEDADAVVLVVGRANAPPLLVPFFSPDGRWLAFFQGGQLKKVQVDGGTPVTICSIQGVAPPVGASWAENDEILLGAQNTIVRVNANGGTPEPIVLTSQDQPLAASPQSLPGGKWFLYMASRGEGTNDQWRVMARSRTTNEQKVLVDGARVAMYVGSGHLVYGRGNALFAVAFNPGDATIHGVPVQVLDGVAPVSSSAAMHVAISGNGTLLYAPDSSVGLATRLAQITRSGARTPLIDAAGVAWFPRVAPDGTRVAYGISEGTDLNSPADLWVIDLARGARTRVTFSGNNRFYPIWTRDGKRLTFGDNTTPTNRLRWALADGSGGLETLVDVGTRRYPTSWSPDGSTLAFYVGGASSGGPTTQAPNRDVWMLHVEGEKRTQTAFVAEPFEERGGIFSPSGRWLAYVSNKSGQNDVYARPYPGPGGEVTISVGGGQEPVWGPGGKELFYRHAGKLLSVSIEEAAGALKVGSPVPLFDDTFRPDTGGATGGMANYDIAPDGQHFVVVEEQRQNDGAPPRLQVVLNWTEELKQRVPTAR